MKTDRELLTPPELAAALADLPGWSVADRRLHREYRFRNFTEAWAFMTGCAIEAQAMNHHPDWSNVYARVTVDLWTHDRNGITQLDAALARRFEELARKLLAPGS